MTKNIIRQSFDVSLVDQPDSLNNIHVPQFTTREILRLCPSYMHLVLRI